MADRPMNPYAERDFSNAIKDASEELEEICKQMKDRRLPLTTIDDIPYIKFDDLKPEYCGTMRLKPTALWESLMDTLLDEGYEVTVRKEDATETEKQLDGVEKWIVIEYGEVE